MNASTVITMVVILLVKVIEDKGNLITFVRSYQ